MRIRNGFKKLTVVAALFMIQRNVPFDVSGCRGSHFQKLRMIPGGASLSMHISYKPNLLRSVVV